VQLRPATGTGAPTSDILAETEVLESSLGNYAWKEYAFSNLPWRTPSERLCVVVRQTANDVACQAKFEGGNVALPNHALVESANQGASWQVTSDKGLWFRVRGTYFTVDPTPHVVTRRYATGVRATLRTGARGDSRVVSQIPLLNTPELLMGFWKLDFDGDPRTVDVNYDGVADWSEASGSGLDNVAALSDSVWQASAASNVTLRTQGDADFTGLTTIELRCRGVSYDPAGYGAHLVANIDRDGNSHGVVRVSVRKEANGSQSARVYATTSPAAETIVAEATGLSTEMVEFRLVVDPTADVVATWINGVFQSTVPYVRSTGNSDRFFSLGPSSSDAEFDYVSIRVSDPN
jgi:hypothetical protein